MVHLQMLTTQGRVPVTPAQAICPSFHPALGGLVQLGCLCSSAERRWVPRGEAWEGQQAPQRRTQERRSFALPGDLRVPEVTISCDTVANLWSLRMPPHWCISWRWGFACLKMLWAPLELAWTQSDARQWENALCFQGDFAGKWWGSTEII